jgi:RNase P/RNase MRP subunit p30
MTAQTVATPHPNDPDVTRAALESEVEKLSRDERSRLLSDIDAALARIGSTRPESRTA